ncbi:TetR/AcrR family transcriptional regulator [Rhodopseudomonas palustris]|uniref:TetR/AcrR family transcriptional regulator n=1 Tax=Rhodopseudomonas palustris TaxID=1076 RepID=A0A418VKN2_RHOPL|nr:TetR/AcrR family transcriptional regulator [Rhodopseudomonas palustris]RJF76703.1 TetR/AcrR family transcriptional regulator [Rhodopseudomonas palustris]
MTNLSTADQILACARGLIIAGGYNGFSYADIADAVGIRKPSIHHHFPTKAELVQKLVAQYRKDAAAGLAHLAREASDPAAQLRSYTGYWAACIKDGSAPFCVCALLATELPLLPDEVAAEVRAHFRALSAWLKSALERGHKDGSLALKDTPRAEAEIFMATVHGAMLSARAYGEPKMFAAITNPLIDRLCKG